MRCKHRKRIPGKDMIVLSIVFFLAGLGIGYQLGTHDRKHKSKNSTTGDVYCGF